MGRKGRDDNEINEVLYGGKWETHEGRSVPVGHADRKAAHEASRKQHAKDAYAEFDSDRKH